MILDPSGVVQAVCGAEQNQEYRQQQHGKIRVNGFMYACTYVRTYVCMYVVCMCEYIMYMHDIFK